MAMLLNPLFLLILLFLQTLIGVVLPKDIRDNSLNNIFLQKWSSALKPIASAQQIGCKKPYLETLSADAFAHKNIKMFETTKAA